MDECPRLKSGPEEVAWLSPMAQVMPPTLSVHVLRPISTSATTLPHGEAHVIHVQLQDRQ